MIACYARVKDLSREELEALAVGQGTDDECEVTAAGMELALQDAWEEGDERMG